MISGLRTTTSRISGGCLTTGHPWATTAKDLRTTTGPSTRTKWEITNSPSLRRTLRPRTLARPPLRNPPTIPSHLSITGHLWTGHWNRKTIQIITGTFGKREVTERGKSTPEILGLKRRWLLSPSQQGETLNMLLSSGWVKEDFGGAGGGRFSLALDSGLDSHFLSPFLPLNCSVMEPALLPRPLFCFCFPLSNGPKGVFPSQCFLRRRRQIDAA